jgi:hypothetical protein
MATPKKKKSVALHLDPSVATLCILFTLHKILKTEHKELPSQVQEPLLKVEKLLAQAWESMEDAVYKDTCLVLTKLLEHWEQKTLAPLLRSESIEPAIERFETRSFHTSNAAEKSPRTQKK